MAKRAWTVLLIGLPVVVGILWLASGREIFTKSGKAVDVQVRDELFGTTFVQKHFVPGPIFGHYVGLDLVIVAAIACLAAWAISAWVLHSKHGRTSRPWHWARGHPGGLR